MALYKLIVANLLIHVAAAFALLLVAACSASLELRGRRKLATFEAGKHENHTVVELPTAPRAPKLASRANLEEQSEAA